MEEKKQLPCVKNMPTTLLWQEWIGLRSRITSYQLRGKDGFLDDWNRYNEISDELMMRNGKAQHEAC